MDEKIVPVAGIALRQQTAEVTRQYQVFEFSDGSFGLDLSTVFVDQSEHIVSRLRFTPDGWTLLKLAIAKELVPMLP